MAIFCSNIFPFKTFLLFQLRRNHYSWIRAETRILNKKTKLKVWKSYIVKLHIKSLLKGHWKKGCKGGGGGVNIPHSLRVWLLLKPPIHPSQNWRIPSVIAYVLSRKVKFISLQTKQTRNFGLYIDEFEKIFLFETI